MVDLFLLPIESHLTLHESEINYYHQPLQVGFETSSFASFLLHSAKLNLAYSSVIFVSLLFQSFVRMESRLLIQTFC
jgi:hypothetical protein